MRRTFNTLLVSLAIMTISNMANAYTMKWCVQQVYDYVDGDHGEDYLVNSSLGLYEDARYVQAKVINVTASPDATVWEGFLDDQGCTPNVTHLGETHYHFRHATYMKRNTNRKVIALADEQFPPDGDPLWVQEEYTSGEWVVPEDEVTYYSPWSNQAQVLVVAERMLYFHTTREYPNNTTTYLVTHDDLVGSETDDDTCYFDTNYDTDGDGDGINLTGYKFATGHELGHRQAYATGGPINVDYTRTSSNDRCNCDHFDGVYDSMCFQSREYTGTAQMEAWAYFYSAALMNSDSETDCGMSYWRAMYVGSDPSSSTLDETPPVGVNCAWLPKWQIDVGCNSDERAILQDWLGFYWNLWRVGTYKYSIDEISNVWAGTADPAPTGETWAGLAATVNGYSSGKKNQFINTGQSAGVDH